MEIELLNIFDEQHNPIGVASREEVHKHGHWHETFNCWFVCRENGIEYIYFQLRCAAKKDFPNHLDITAAGHLLAYETVIDGVREVKEEVGIDLSFDDLVPLGVLKYCMTKHGFIDKEIAHLFLYPKKVEFNAFKLQEEEVSGIVRAELSAFSKLWCDEADTIAIEGFEIDENRERVAINTTVDKDKFVPHEDDYYKTTIKLVYEYIEKGAVC
nr:NUDIX domain-containing protein [Scopulibacillus darangshiensis]